MSFLTEAEAEASREHLVTDGADLLEQVASEIADRRPCLLRFEQYASEYHRQFVAEEMSKRTRQGVEHL